MAETIAKLMEEQKEEQQNRNVLLKKWLYWWNAGTISFLVLSLVFAILAYGLELKFFASTFLYWLTGGVLIAAFTRWVISFWEDRFLNEEQHQVESMNPYRRKFFKAINYISVLMLVFGLIGVVMLATGSNGNFYHAMALLMIVVWSVIFIQYFIWAVYFYNINYGYTDRDWVRIMQMRELKMLGQHVPAGSTDGPSENPYKDQTFGLPKGTVRGMIAFTLLFGGLAMLLASMGSANEYSQNILFRDHFEFFKDAFLMMIAFYFGEKSLQYLRQQNTQPANVVVKPRNLDGAYVEPEDAPSDKPEAEDKSDPNT